MSDFHSNHIVTARKPHRCDQCGTAIDKGAKHARCAGSYYGDFYSYRIHGECEAAARAYANLHGLWGEEWPWFYDQDAEVCDWQWMVEHHPVVAKRLGWDEKLAEYTREDA